MLLLTICHKKCSESTVDPPSKFPLPPLGPWTTVIQMTYTTPDLSYHSFLALTTGFGLRWACWSEIRLDHRVGVIQIPVTCLIAKYNLLPSLTSSIGAFEGSCGELAVVTRPPASRRIAIPAATSL